MEHKDMHKKRRALRNREYKVLLESRSRHGERRLRKDDKWVQKYIRQGEYPMLVAEFNNDV